MGVLETHNLVTQGLGSLMSPVNLRRITSNNARMRALANMNSNNLTITGAEAMHYVSGIGVGGVLAGGGSSGGSSSTAENMRRVASSSSLSNLSKSTCFFSVF